MNWLISRAQAAFNLGLPLSNQNSSNLTFNDYFVQLVNVAVVIAIAFSVLIVVYAGFMYAQSQGDAAKVSTAKELVSGVLIGLAILLLIKLILPTLGINP